MEYYNNGTGVCNYGLAIAASVMTTLRTGGRPVSPSATSVRMLNDLKTRISDSRICKSRKKVAHFLLFWLTSSTLPSSPSPDPGACFLCNSCPDDEEEEDQGSSTADCPSRPRGEGSASCVETTAYALEALLHVRDTEKTVCLARWLVQIKSASGGFYSSQVKQHSSLMCEVFAMNRHFWVILLHLIYYPLGHNKSPH